MRFLYLSIAWETRMHLFTKTWIFFRLGESRPHPPSQPVQATIPTKLKLLLSPTEPFYVLNLISIFLYDTLDIIVFLELPSGTSVHIPNGQTLL